MDPEGKPILWDPFEGRLLWVQPYGVALDGRTLYVLADDDEGVVA
jgi:hypothetical protein